MNIDYERQDKDVLELLTGQFEEIISNYRNLLEEAERERDAAKLETAIYKAKIVSLEAERDALIQTMKDGGFVPPDDTADQELTEGVRIDQTPAFGSPVCELPNEELDPDFEEQKEMLLEVQEELARLEEKLREEL